ncbi:kynureninase [Pontibacter sp. G13]|uniref:kynureninase n=1 Tax=Pontibacter sp. G13 TaxID=3074898 RepID=UPI00288B4C09|nr:kynureninase [Pontibacter sp. G13]WNJ16151.1 kynureninase [Pontibacter sp. G13]
MTLTYESSLEFARSMDQQDPLRSYRDQFHLPVQPSGEPYIYLCGNSLGCQPKRLRAFVEQELKDWENLGVEGHFHAKNPWMPYHEFLTEPMAKIVGAKSEEVVVMNALTVNLHLMMVSFYRPSQARFKIVIEGDAFPSDIYAVESQLKFHGYDPKDALIKLWPREGEHTIRTEDIEHLLAEQGQEIALVMLGGVNYYTGQAFQFQRIVEAGHAQGCKVGFDLAHAVGNLELKLHEWGADFACWCSYKYLNSGPGGVAGVFVHERHLNDPEIPRFAGWWGHDKETRFKMGPDFQPIPTAESWQLSNAPVLSMAALRASLEIFEEVGMAALREKALKLTGYLEYLLTEGDDLKGIEIITPKDPDHRGCQLSLLTGADGKQRFDALTEAGVICDWREPNVIRLAPVPLYNSFEDVWHFAKVLRNL